jgi:hypothetical membrane protein
MIDLSRATDAKGISANSTTRALLACGLIAGPLFLVTVVIQGCTRPGFNLSHQPVSFLSLGSLGWIQMTNFIASGLLLVAFALGVRRALISQPGGTWGPLFIGGLGLALAIAGLFPPDAAFGFPPGTPDGLPRTTTYHSTMHGIGFTFSFLSFALACIVFARKDAADRRWVGVVYTAMTAAAALVLGMTPGTNGIALRDLAASVLLWTWIVVQATRLMVDQRAVPNRGEEAGD